MIKIIIEIARALAILKFFYKKIFSADPKAMEQMRVDIREAYKNAKENNDPSAIASVFNKRR